jgi:hypothetical protein
MSDYRQDPRINSSKLKCFLGRDYDPIQAVMDSRQGIGETQSMAVGTGLHEIMEVGVENAKFEAIERMYKTKGPRENAIQLAKDMAQAIWEKSPSHIIHHIEHGQHEQEFYTDEFKALLDVVDGTTGMDFKTTSAATLAEFKRDFFKYCLEVQEHHYRKVAKLDRFYFVVVSKAKGHPVWIIETTVKCLEYGEAQWELAYQRYKETESLEIPTMAREAIITAPKWWTETPNDGEDLSTFY